MQFKHVLRAATALVAIASITVPAFAQEEAAPESDRKLETVVTLGTRVANRSALDTAVAVDVVSSATLEKIGIGELNQPASCRTVQAGQPPQHQDDKGHEHQVVQEPQVGANEQALREIA